MSDLPPFQPLPDHIRDAARQRITEGLHTPVWKAPLAIAAAVVTLAVGAVVAGVTLYGTAPLATPPTRDLPQLQGPDLNKDYQVVRGGSTPETAKRCGGKSWQHVATATANGITLSAFTVENRRVFCAVTATTVTVSPPLDKELDGRPARLLFRAPNGAMAGLVAPGTTHLSVVSQGSAPGAIIDTIFLAPAGIADVRAGVKFLVNGNEVPADNVPVVIPAVTDRPLPPANRETAEGKRLGQCLRDQLRGIPDPAQFAPGAHVVLSEHSEIQLGRFGDLLVECRVRDGGNQDPREAAMVSDLRGLTQHRTLRSRYYFYDFSSDGTATSSERRAVIGQVIDDRVHSITLVQPGEPGQAAVIANGTFVLRGPVSFDVYSRVIVRDAGGQVLEEITLRE